MLIFLNFYLEFVKEVLSRWIQKSLHSRFFGGRLVWKSSFLWAGALLFDQKNSPKCFTSRTPNNLLNLYLTPFTGLRIRPISMHCIREGIKINIKFTENLSQRFEFFQSKATHLTTEYLRRIWRVFNKFVNGSKTTKLILLDSLLQEKLSTANNASSQRNARW
jgi:hypothetical protein